MRNFRSRLILVVIPGKVQDTGPPEPLPGNSASRSQVGLDYLKGESPRMVDGFGDYGMSRGIPKTPQ